MTDKTPKMPKGLNGPEGLLTAVICLAVNDATGRDKEARSDAWRYLASENYTNHVTALGLPSDILPKAIEDLAHETM